VGFWRSEYQENDGGVYFSASVYGKTQRKFTGYGAFDVVGWESALELVRDHYYYMTYLQSLSGLTSFPEDLNIPKIWTKYWWKKRFKTY